MIREEFNKLTKLFITMNSWDFCFSTPAAFLSGERFQALRKPTSLMFRSSFRVRSSVFVFLLHRKAAHIKGKHCVALFADRMTEGGRHARRVEDGITGGDSRRELTTNERQQRVQCFSNLIKRVRRSVLLLTSVARLFLNPIHLQKPGFAIFH